MRTQLPSGIIGSAYIDKPPQMSNDAEAVRRALLDFRGTADDSRFTTQGHMRQRAQPGRVRVGRRGVWWRVARVMRELRAWLLSSRAF